MRQEYWSGTCPWAWVNDGLDKIVADNTFEALLFNPIPTKEVNHYALNYGCVTVPMSQVYNQRRSEISFARAMQAEMNGIHTSMANDLLKEVYEPAIREHLNWSVLDRAAEWDEVWWTTKQRMAWKRRFINGRRRLAEAIAGQKLCNDWDCYCGREDY